MNKAKTPKQLLKEDFAGLNLDVETVIGAMDLGEDDGKGKKPITEMKARKGNRLKKVGSAARVQHRQNAIDWKRNKSSEKRAHHRWAMSAGGKRYKKFMSRHAGLVKRLNAMGRRVSTKESGSVADRIFSRLSEGVDTTTNTNTPYACQAFAQGAEAVAKLTRRYAGMGDESAIDALLTLGERFHEAFEFAERGGDAVLTEDFEKASRVQFQALMDAVRLYQDEHSPVGPMALAGF